MSDFLNRVENFLFDILGLVLPGIIFISLVILPVYLINVDNCTPTNTIKQSYILSMLVTVRGFIDKQIITNNEWLTCLILIFAYLIGHFVKVFSIIQYDFMKVIFNDILIKGVNWINKLLLGFINYLYKLITSNDIYNSSTFQKITKLIAPVINTLDKIFSFTSPNYDHKNDSLKTYCVNKINSKLSTTFPNHWYSIYKLGSIVNIQENSKSLASTFLAKYNLYRSLSFIFSFITIYLYIFFKAAGTLVPEELIKIHIPIITISALFWLTFHYKFKKYWTLCGNETLMSLFYFLTKKELNQ